MVELSVKYIMLVTFSALTYDSAMELRHLRYFVAISLYDHVISACQSAGFSPAITSSPILVTTVLTLVAVEQGVSIVPEGVQNLRSRQVVLIPISPAIDSIPLVMCWNAQSTWPPQEAFRKLVQEQAETIEEEYVESGWQSGS